MKKQKKYSRYVSTPQNAVFKLVEVVTANELDVSPRQSEPSTPSPNPNPKPETRNTKHETPNPEP